MGETEGLHLAKSSDFGSIKVLRDRRTESSFSVEEERRWSMVRIHKVSYI